MTYPKDFYADGAADYEYKVVINFQQNWDNLACDKQYQTFLWLENDSGISSNDWGVDGEFLSNYWLMNAKDLAKLDETQLWYELHLSFKNKNDAILCKLVCS